MERPTTLLIFEPPTGKRECLNSQQIDRLQLDIVVPLAVSSCFLKHLVLARNRHLLWHDFCTKKYGDLFYA
jgi:hypothetical protein